jgi:hypothetical protein
MNKTHKMHRGEIFFHLVVPLVMVTIIAAIGFCAVVLSIEILKVV